MVISLILLGIGISILCAGIVDGWEEFELIQNGKTTSGFIIDTWEDAEPNDGGGVDWYHGAKYTYVLPDGRDFEDTTSGSGRLKEEFRYLSQPLPIEVEYLPNKPSISRIKGDGPNSIPDIFRDQFWPYGLLTPIFLLMGGYYLWATIRDMKRIPPVATGTSAW